jgi:hypothetical protein
MIDQLLDILLIEKQLFCLKDAAHRHKNGENEQKQEHEGRRSIVKTRDLLEDRRKEKDLNPNKTCKAKYRKQQSYNAFSSSSSTGKHEPEILDKQS